MTNTEIHQFLLEVLEHVEKGESLEFRFITSWFEFDYYRRQAQSTKTLIKILESSSNRLFKDYCNDVIFGISHVNKLLAYSQLQDIIAFYQKDLDTINKMLDDYDDYLGQGHFWYSFFGGERDIWNVR